MLGWSEWQLNDATPRFLHNSITAYQSRRRADSRERWEIARYQGYFSVRPYADDKLRFADLGLFSWEEEETPWAPSEDDIKAAKDFAAEAAAFFASMNKPQQTSEHVSALN